jgi:hypothetical protein
LGYSRCTRSLEFSREYLDLHDTALQLEARPKRVLMTMSSKPWIAAAVAAAGLAAAPSADAQLSPVQLLVLNTITISAKAQFGIYPGRAREARKSGSAVVRCSGKAGVRLSGCVVADEWPASLDFGANALAIATSFNASHLPVDPATEAAVVVRVDFEFPDAPPPSPPIPMGGWDHRPTIEDLTLYYPENAATMDQEGWTLVRCVVAPHGELSQCILAAEAPTGFGFGKAALTLTKDYRMKLSAGLVGKTITFPINFRLPKTER